MRTANPNELKENAFPVMTAKLSEAELTKWFPVSFQEVTGPWAAPEPSKGALVRLDDGEYLVLDYGRDSNQLTVRIPTALDPSACLASLFREVPMPRSRILWRRADARLPGHVAAKRIAARSAADRSKSTTSSSSGLRTAKK